MKFTRVARVKGNSTLGMLSLAAAAMGPSASSNVSASSRGGGPRPGAAILRRFTSGDPAARALPRAPSVPARAGPAGAER